MAIVKDEKSGMVSRKGSPLLGALIAALMVALVLFGLWYYSRPTPPTILDQRLSLSPKESEIEDFHGLNQNDFVKFYSPDGKVEMPYPIGYYAVEGSGVGRPMVSFGASTPNGGFEAIDVFVVPGALSRSLAQSVLSLYQSDSEVSEFSMNEYSANRRSAYLLTATKSVGESKVFLKTILVDCGDKTIRISSSIPSDSSDDLFLAEYMAHYLKC